MGLMTADIENKKEVTEAETTYKEERQMSKAATLAMQLSKEKTRLQQELHELQEEFDVVKPTTPTGTVDWYIKWISVIAAVTGVFLISANMVFAGQVAYILSSIGWVYVGMQWSDRAIMIGSSISGTAVAMNLVQTLIQNG
jgi:hypothetical protein